MEQQLEDNTAATLTKKEALDFQRHVAKLNKSIGGIKEMTGLPDALFIVDVGYHKIAIQEAQTLGCAVIASDCAGNREQIVDGEDGLLCTLTPEGIAEKSRRTAG